MILLAPDNPIMNLMFSYPSFRSALFHLALPKRKKTATITSMIMTATDAICHMNAVRKILGSSSGDAPAGLEHFGRAVAEGFTCAVVVADHSYNAVSVARKSAALARQLGIGEVILVINRAQEENELQNTCGNSGGLAEFSETVVLPFDLEVSRTEPAVTPLFGGESVFMKNVGVLAATIAGRCERPLLRGQ